MLTTPGGAASNRFAKMTPAFGAIANGFVIAPKKVIKRGHRFDDSAKRFGAAPKRFAELAKAFGAMTNRDGAAPNRFDAYDSRLE